MLAIDGEKLILADRVPSGGTTPVSVTVHKHVVYVLNRGDFDIGDGNITGFTVDSHGKLTPIPDSTQLLVARRAARASSPPDSRPEPATVGCR